MGGWWVDRWVGGRQRRSQASYPTHALIMLPLCRLPFLSPAPGLKSPPRRSPAEGKAKAESAAREEEARAAYEALLAEEESSRRDKENTVGGQRMLLILLILILD